MKQTLGQRKQADVQARRRYAYHEAGHATIHWMFGESSNIAFIDMQGYYGAWAFVQARRRNIPATVQCFDQTDAATRKMTILQAKQWLIHDLAGYAAQSRVDHDLGSNWFKVILEESGWECFDDHDLHRAVCASKALCGNGSHAWRLLRQMASWTDEALDHPRLWAVVESLANRLQTVKTRISGRRVMSIMDKACPDAVLPVMDMGHNWRRRFCAGCN